MGYRISIDEREKIAEIRFDDEMPHGDHVRARAELLEICRARNFHKILVDARSLAGTAPTTMELFDFGVSWAELAQQTRILLAGVVRQDVATQSWWKFGETVAVNRGLVTQAFDDIDQARSWLRDA